MVTIHATVFPHLDHGSLGAPGDVQLHLPREPLQLPIVHLAPVHELAHLQCVQQLNHLSEHVKKTPNSNYGI